MNNMKKMVVFVIVCAMMLSVAACGNTTPVGDEVSDAPVVNEDVDTFEDDEEEEAVEEVEKSMPVEESEEEEPATEEPVDETPDFKVMYFIEWGSGRGVHSSFRVKPEDEWSCNIDFWADYDVEDGMCNIHENKEGLYYEAPIDFTRLVTGDKEETYIMVCDQDKKFVVVYLVDESKMADYVPWEGYDSVSNGHFAVWYNADLDVDTAQRILDSCVMLRGDELDQTFSELQSRYVP